MVFDVIETHQAPVFKHPGMEKILIDCDKLISQ